MVKKQLDIYVRYWSTIKDIVVCRYFKSLMFGHAIATNVSENLVEVLAKEKLDLKRMIALGSDGPNVNKSIYRNVEKKVTENYGNPGLQDWEIGTCNLHVVHNAFGKGLKEFGSEVEELLIDLNSLRPEERICIMFRYPLAFHIICLENMCRADGFPLLLQWIALLSSGQPTPSTSKHLVKSLSENSQQVLVISVCVVNSYALHSS